MRKGLLKSNWIERMCFLHLVKNAECSDHIFSGIKTVVIKTRKKLTCRNSTMENMMPDEIFAAWWKPLQNCIAPSTIQGKQHKQQRNSGIHSPPPFGFICQTRWFLFRGADTLIFWEAIGFPKTEMNYDTLLMTHKPLGNSGCGLQSCHQITYIIWNGFLLRGL